MGVESLGLPHARAASDPSLSILFSRAVHSVSDLGSAGAPHRTSVHHRTRLHPAHAACAPTGTGHPTRSGHLRGLPFAAPAAQYCPDRPVDAVAPCKGHGVSSRVRTCTCTSCTCPWHNLITGDTLAGTRIHAHVSTMVSMHMPHTSTQRLDTCSSMQLGRRLTRTSGEGARPRSQRKRSNRICPWEELGSIRASRLSLAEPLLRFSRIRRSLHMPPAHDSLASDAACTCLLHMPPRVHLRCTPSNQVYGCTWLLACGSIAVW